jgi:hypothetical protein
MGLPLNAGNSSPTDDITSNGNDATLQGGAAIDGKVLSIEQASGPAEADYNTFGFDGTDDYIATTTNVVDLQNLNSNSYTFSIWIKTTSNAIGELFRCAGSASGGGSAQVSILVNATTVGGLGVLNKATMAVYGGSTWTGSWVPSTTDVNDGNLHLITGIWDASTQKIKIYVDGSLEGTLSVSTRNVSLNPATLYIGSDVTFFPHESTMAIIHNKVLTDAEVADLYNAGKIPYYETLPSNLTSDVNLAIEMSSRDNSLNDLSGNGNNGTANGGVTDDGDLQTFASYS